MLCHSFINHRKAKEIWTCLYILSYTSFFNYFCSQLALFISRRLSCFVGDVSLINDQALKCDQVYKETNFIPFKMFWTERILINRWLIKNELTEEESSHTALFSSLLNNSGQFQIFIGLKLKRWLNLYVLYDPSLV